MINPLPMYIGLLLGLVGVLALRAGIKDRRGTVAASGLLFLAAGAGLIALAVVVG
jgi:hypothetical protein